MGGGAMYIGLPMIHFKASSSAPPSQSSSSSSSLNFPISVSNSIPSRQSCNASCVYCSSGTGNCARQESVHGNEDRRTNGYLYDVMFGPVPSKIEVESAIASLRSFMHGNTSTSGTEFNRLRQILDCNDLRTLLSQGYGRVRDAFSLLQTDPSIKRLVVSLSSDKAVWDAVMNNEVVRQLQKSCCTGESCRSQSSDEAADIASHMFRWIMDVTKAKVNELIQKFQSLLNDIFQANEKEIPRGETSKQADDKIRSSLLLSIVILLIVVVARAQKGLITI